MIQSDTNQTTISKKHIYRFCQYCYKLKRYNRMANKEHNPIDVSSFSLIEIKSQTEMVQSIRRLH